MLSLIVSGMAPVVPWLLEYAGPTTMNALPVQTFTCWFVVSYHRSPVTFDVGCVELAVEKLTVLNIVPL